MIGRNLRDLQILPSYTLGGRLSDETIALVIKNCPNLVIFRYNYDHPFEAARAIDLKSLTLNMLDLEHLELDTSNSTFNLRSVESWKKSPNGFFFFFCRRLECSEVAAESHLSACF
jgi:hypothetical protein